MHKVTGQHIQVTCAIIECDGLVLAAQRSETMSLPLQWEFPGGKIHQGESPEECLAREIDEELGVKITINGSLNPSTHRYPSVSVTLYPFLCYFAGGSWCRSNMSPCNGFGPMNFIPLTGLKPTGLYWPNFFGCGEQ
jgi:mutator protein MutT